MMRLVLRSGDILQVWFVEERWVGTNRARETKIWLAMQIISALYSQSWIGYREQAYLVNWFIMARR